MSDISSRKYQTGNVANEKSLAVIYFHRNQKLWVMIKTKTEAHSTLRSLLTLNLRMDRVKYLLAFPIKPFEGRRDLIVMKQFSIWLDGLYMESLYLRLCPLLEKIDLIRSAQGQCELMFFFSIGFQ